MTQTEIDKFIAEQFLAHKGLIDLDLDDVEIVTRDSDFLDGTWEDGKLDDLAPLAERAIRRVREAHPDSRLSHLVINLRIADGYELLMEQVNTLNDIFSRLDGVEIRWGIEYGPALPDELRVCIIAGFMHAGINP